MSEKHSRVGIASFMMALAACALVLIIPFILAAAYSIYLIEPTSGEIPIPDEALQIVLAVITLLGSLPFAVVAVVLGVKALRQEHRRTTFPVLGIVLSALYVALAGFVGLVIFIEQLDK